MRRKLIQRIVVIILSFVLVLSYSVYSNAELENMDRDSLAQEIIDEISLIEMDKSSTTDPEIISELNSEIEHYNQILESLGVEVLTNDEVNERFGPESPNVSIPNMQDTNTSNWYLYSPTTVVRNGVSYTVRNLVQAGKPGGSLYGSGAQMMINGQPYDVYAYQTLGAIGMMCVVNMMTNGVPELVSGIVTGTAGEMLGISYSGVFTITQAWMEYTSAEQIAYTYVKPTSSSESSYTLSFWSNKVVFNGKLKGKGILLNSEEPFEGALNTIRQATYFMSASAAVGSYLGINGNHDYITRIDMNCSNGSTAYYYPAITLSGPGSLS